MSTEINFMNPIGGLINLFKAATTVTDIAVKASTAAKEREEKKRYKSELIEMGITVDSIRSAWGQGKITFEEYQTYKTILES